MSTRVLVVDDSPTIRKVVSSVLERHGFEAVQAADGQAALEQLVNAARPTLNGAGDEAEKIDVVLVDFVMPRMNGFQLCRAIRHDELLRDTPVVLMSAKSDRIRDHFVQQTGAIDAITKPFEAQALIAVIENAIRRSAEWRERERGASARTASAPRPKTPIRPIRSGHRRRPAARRAAGRHRRHPHRRRAAAPADRGAIGRSCSSPTARPR